MLPEVLLDRVAQVDTQGCEDVLLVLPEVLLVAPQRVPGPGLPELHQPHQPPGLGEDAQQALADQQQHQEPEAVLH